MSCKVLAASAGDHTPAEVTSDPDCEFQNRRNHNDAFGLVQQVLRNAVRDVHDFLEHLTARFQALLLPALTRAEGRIRQKHRLFSWHYSRTTIRFLRRRPRNHNCASVWACPKEKLISMRSGVDKT